jgi:hypothetical protein
MSQRMAGTALGMGGLGAALGAGGLALSQYIGEQMTPAHSREMTQQDHARNNIGDLQQRMPGVTDMELALYEGIRQGLMSGAITGSEVNAMAKQGKLPANVISLLTDVHDWSSAEPYPFGSRTIPEVAAAADLRGGA